MSEKQKAIGQSAPSGHQGVHQSGDLVKDHAYRKLEQTHKYS